ncbi:hypothetical protein XFEB_00624 [Xylella fastidiosa EB92.1]|jgi:hypothetical protein|nr:hypothetical protein XFEB_00624 [Xylella fastidiosa EB92.1]
MGEESRWQIVHIMSPNLISTAKSKFQANLFGGPYQLVFAMSAVFLDAATCPHSSIGICSHAWWGGQKTKKNIG